MLVACYNAFYFGEAFAIRNSDFEAARNDPTSVCDLTFDVNNGRVNTTEILSTAVFDNSFSDTILESKYTFQKERQVLPSTS